MIRGSVVIAVGLVLLAVGTFFVVIATSGPTVIEYRVEGAFASSLVHVTTPESGPVAGDTVRQVQLPWSTTVEVDEQVVVELAATNGYNGAGPLSCTILVDGRVVDHQAAEGLTAAVSCKGRT